ncbi:nuclease-related domain-containing protein [Sporosarcina sp. ACRSL]|uniref:nuclease-related domain-containing protein n=1 Tax=Sporosarcina sp. ACRSL TaxID=2918215 RepID=UPI001EF67638|nr:nuclease-related domain-containing protein [Sporosarcina sp. ACRSL]
MENILKEVHKVRAGENGERILESVFNKYSFPFEHYILHDLNLQSSGKFQIDTLFLSSQGAVILEVKNIAGRIEFPQDQNQLIRVLENGQVDAFECPSVQLERNMILLKDWLFAKGYSIPVRGAVVFPRPQQNFENVRKNLTLLFPYEIPVYLRKHKETSPSLDSKTLNAVAKDLLYDHRRYNPFPLTKSYNIQPSELVPGVRCENCGTHGMQTIHSGWGCKSCGYIDKFAHIQAFLEYCMLIDFQFTNSDIRSFFRTDNKDRVSRMLKYLEIPSTGKNRGVKYSVGLSDLERLYEMQKGNLK